MFHDDRRVKPVSNMPRRRVHVHNNNNNQHNNTIVTGDGFTSPIVIRRNNTTQLSGAPMEPFQKFEEMNASTPTTAKVRWFLIAGWVLAFLAVVIVFGLLVTRDLRRQKHLSAQLEQAELRYALADLLATNITPPPPCIVVNNLTIGSSFSDAEFSVYSSAAAAGDSSSADAGYITFALGTLLASMQTVVWSFQNTSTLYGEYETLAYLDDIRATNITVFKDGEFTIENAVTHSKRVQFDLSGLNSTGVPIILSAPDQSGDIALLGDIPTQPTTFLSDVFAVENAADNTKELMLDLSQITSDYTSVLTIQDIPGEHTFLLLESITGQAPPYNDTQFIVYQDGDPTATARLDLSLISGGGGGSNNITLVVPSGDGTIAYLENLPQIVEITVNTTRAFPDPSFEGVSNLTQLGTIDWIEVSVCGGGGGGGSGFAGAGGGSGSGHQSFRIYSPSDKFYRFSCQVGPGGIAGSGDGSYSTLQGLSTSDYFLNLVGYGGGGGDPMTLGGAVGGAGGGGGASASGVVPGGAGSEGGLSGGLGGKVTAPNVLTDGSRGEISLTWRAGGGGSAATPNTTATPSLAAAWNGGYATNDSSVCDGNTGCGAASMFGPGGVGSASNPDAPSYCAGGGSDGAGGGGACQFRYYLSASV